MLSSETSDDLRPVSESELETVEGGAYAPVTLVMLAGPLGIGMAGGLWWLKITN
jgi:hypothetical protein